MANFGPWPLLPMPTLVNPVTGLPISPKEIEWQDIDIVGSTDNTFTEQQQVYPWNWARMEASLSWVLTNFQAQLMRAWLNSIQGINAVFPFGDPVNISPQNPAAFIINVNGANQSGFSLNVNTYGNQSVGNWIAIPGPSSYAPAGAGTTAYNYSTGTRLYRVTSVASGTLGVWPNLREPPTSGQAIGISNCQGMFRRKNNSVHWTQHTDKTWSLTFEIREAI